MLTQPVLHNVRLLITRPKHQANSLSSQLKQLGAQCFLYPTLAIEPYKQDSVSISQLIKHDYLIFTSANAVLALTPVLEQLHKHTQLPTLIAIGSATQHSLTNLGLTSDCPESEASSEGILALDNLQHCYEQSIGIVGGVGGRRLLQNQLSHRGANVQTFEVYRRIPTKKPTLSELSNWQNPGIDIIICTSGEGLTQLVTCFEEINKDAKLWLLEQQLLVMSERLVPIAKQLTFLKTPLVAKTQSDKGIIQTLITHQGNNHVRDN